MSPHRISPVDRHVVDDGVSLGEIVVNRRTMTLHRSQLRIAIAAGITPNTLINIEGCQVDPKFSNVLRIVEALGGRVVIEWKEEKP